MRASGLTAEIRWVYQTAATVGPWQLERGLFTGQIVSGDRFRLTQKPLTLLIPKRGRPWEWPITSITVTGDTLTATVMMQEVPA